jgi:hypothetical protein
MNMGGWEDKAHKFKPQESKIFHFTLFNHYISDFLVMGFFFNLALRTGNIILNFLNIGILLSSPRIL